MSMPLRAAVVILALVALSAAVFAADNGMARVPALGWSSWCDEGGCGNDYCHESEIKAVALAMKANGMYALGYQWILLDDCWAAGNRTANGSITWDVSRFPSGMPATVDWMHANGFKFGLYTSAGNATCDNGGRPYPIPGSEHHYVQDSNTFAAWNIDYAKIDWCGDVHNMPLDGIAVGAKDYSAFAKALNGTGHPMYLEGVAAYLFLLNTVGTYYNAWRVSTDHHDNWKNTLSVITSETLSLVQGQPGAWPYMDVLMTGGQGCGGEGRDHRHSQAHCPGMTDVEYVTEFTLWSLHQSPLVVATDVRNMTAIMKKCLLHAKLVAMQQDTRTPPGRRVSWDERCGAAEAWMCPLFVRELANGSAFVVLFNADDETHTVHFPLTLVKGWGNRSTAIGVDVWTSKAVRATNGAFAAPVAPHGVVAVIFNAPH